MKTFRREACNVYLWGIFLVFPLSSGHLYQDFTKTKEIVFVLLCAAFLLCGMVALIGGIASDRAMGVPRPSLRELAAKFSALDISLIALGVIVLLSSVTSYFPIRLTMFGEFAQHTSGAVILGLILAYFVLSRYMEAAKTGFVAAWYLSSVVVFVVGLLNHMRFDPLGMHQYTNNPTDTLSFMYSTIGNVDYYVGYLAVVLLFFAAYRADMEKGWRAYAVDALLVVCYMNVWTARASGSFLGILFGLFALVLFSMTSFTRLRSLFWNGILAGIGGLLAAVGGHLRPELYIGIDYEISGILQLHYFWLPFGVVCFAIWLALGRMAQQEKESDVLSFWKKLALPVTAVAVCAMAVAEGLILFYRPIQDVTGRTFIWDDLQKALPMLTLRERLIGVGPGCMDLELMHLELHVNEDLRFLTAHNEAYEFFFLTGILGVAAWFAMAVSFFVSLFRKLLGGIAHAAGEGADEEWFRELCCCGIAFAAYMGQGLTNGPYSPVMVVGYTMLALFRRYQIPDVD